MVLPVLKILDEAFRTLGSGLVIWVGLAGSTAGVNAQTIRPNVVMVTY